MMALGPGFRPIFIHSFINDGPSYYCDCDCYYCWCYHDGMAASDTDSQSQECLFKLYAFIQVLNCVEASLPGPKPSFLIMH